MATEISKTSQEGALEDPARIAIANAVTELSEVLSTSVVALATGAPDTKTVRRWANGERIPAPDRERVLRYLLLLQRVLSKSETSSTIVNWLTGFNVQLDDAPALLLRDYP
ncbi:MAG: hypothetical protein WCC70_04050, partial [Candidatus Aquilonibacter sp.]